eukprot:3474267-Pyramimonas_sp.AAC.1
MNSWRSAPFFGSAPGPPGGAPGAAPGKPRASGRGPSADARSPPGAPKCHAHASFASTRDTHYSPTR